MRAAGMPDFPPGHPRVNTDRIVRYGGRSKKAWYRLWEHASKSGRFYLTGAYGIWGELPATRIETDWSGIDAAERERLQRAQAKQEADEQQKRLQRARFAANRARQQWDAARAAPPEGVATYLDTKGVAHEKGLRYQHDGTLLVPMLRYDVTEAQEADPDYVGPRRLVGLQKIAPDGTKRFNKGAAVEAAACRLGKVPRAGEPILIAESIGTGLTLRLAIEQRHPVFCLFSAHQLAAGAKILRALYPKSPFVICADDDAYLVAGMNRWLEELYGITRRVSPPVVEWALEGRGGVIKVSADLTEDEDGVPALVGAIRVGDQVTTFHRTNAGRTYAHQAARAAGNAVVIVPDFGERRVRADPEAPKRTDFNDLHQSEGLERVRAQVRGELERLELSAQVRRLVDEQIGRARRDKRPRADPGAGAGGDRASPGEPAFDWKGFFERYTLIYPTDTLWDATLREIVKLHPVKIAFGDRLIEFWLRSPERRMVNLDQLVFEPGQATPAGTINLYRGLAREPSTRGRCEQLVELLAYLCGEQGQDQAPVTEWVLKWLARPLQKVGAKMQTAIVMHGPEGTGKNLFFGAVREIYGEYGTLITQTELEDRFNGWLSRRLFLIANEVISRQELRHHVGRLKNMVTETVMPIREMWSPIRYESNHANIVFLTNELQALQLGPGDRRYMVIRTPAAMPKEFYDAVVAEIAAGGVEALYAHLLELELGTFDEHTKPLLTAAKADLIEIGLSSTQFFQQQLYDGLLWPLPYGPCESQDLYQAYQVFCARTGERNPARLNRFSHEFMSMNGVSRLVMDVGQPLLTASEQRRRQATVFVMGELPPDVRGDEHARRAFIRQKAAEFKGALQEFAQDHPLRKSGTDGEGRYGSDW